MYLPPEEELWHICISLPLWRPFGGVGSLVALSTSRYGLAKSAEYHPVADCRLAAGSSKWFSLFRNYTVVNPEKGVIEVERMSCPGMRLCCQLKFQNALWAATEVSMSCTSVPCSRRASLEKTNQEPIKLVKLRVFGTTGTSDEQHDFTSAVPWCIISASCVADT